MKQFYLFTAYLLIAFTAFSQKHYIKWNFISCVAKTFSVSYEYVIQPNLSLQLQTGFYPYQKTPKPYIDFPFGEFASYSQSTTTIHAWGFSLTPELRIYTTQKQNSQGFYYGPYLRYFNYLFNTQSGFVLLEDFSGMELGNFTFTGKGHYAAIRPGFQIGYKWNISKHFCMDLFTGINIGKKKAKMDVVVLEATNATSTQIQGLLHNVAPVFNSGGVSIQDSTHYQIKSTNISAGFRSGFTLGFMF